MNTFDSVGPGGSIFGVPLSGMTPAKETPREKAGNRCHDMPSARLSITAIWEREILELAMAAPHYAMEGEIYFISKNVLLVSKEGLDGRYGTPQVVASPALQHKIYPLLGGCSKALHGKVYAC